MGFFQYHCISTHDTVYHTMSVHIFVQHFTSTNSRLSTLSFWVSNCLSFSQSWVVNNWSWNETALSSFAPPHGVVFNYTAPLKTLKTKPGLTSMPMVKWAATWFHSYGHKASFEHRKLSEKMKRLAFRTGSRSVTLLILGGVSWSVCEWTNEFRDGR